MHKQKKEDNTDIKKNEYYDVLSTEDCFVLFPKKQPVEGSIEINENIILGYN